MIPEAVEAVVGAVLYVRDEAMPSGPMHLFEEIQMGLAVA